MKIGKYKVDVDSVEKDTASTSHMHTSTGTAVIVQPPKQLLPLLAESVPCKGVFDRKYSELHSDRTHGATTAKKMWANEKMCDCCSSYKEWKAKHPKAAQEVQVSADKSTYYKVFPSEEVTVNINSDIITTYVGTIRALAGGPLGACMGTALSDGPHAYTRDACDALVHGKTSNLNRKLHRSHQLRHPRSDAKRSVSSGVNHKFCSAEHLQMALQTRKVEEHKKNEKIINLQAANNKLLHDSWHKHTTAWPFLKTLLHLLENNKLTDFDLSFISTWLGKKEKGRFYRADEQAKKLAILFSNKLGEKMYSTTAPLLGLPSARQAKKICAKELSKQHYLPGINKWPLQRLAERPVSKPLQSGMDGTRIIRTLELYLQQYIVGRQYPPDVRLFAGQLYEVPDSISELNDYVMQTRKNGAYASEAYSFNMSDTTGDYPDVLLGTIPESKSGVTGSHIMSLMMQIEREAFDYNLPLVQTQLLIL